MSNAESVRAGSAALEELSAECARLVDAVRVSDAPKDVLEQARAGIRSLREMLQGHARQGPHSQSINGIDLGSFFREHLLDPHEVMPWSPLIGRLNPVSPRLVFRAVGDRLEGSGSFPVRFAGAPQTVHGGIVAAALDEIMGMVNFLNGAGSFTGTLSVRYHRPTPIDTELAFGAEVIGREGRKIRSRAEIRCEGELTASAEGLFILPR